MTAPQIKKEELNMDSLTWGELTWVNIERPTEKEAAYLAEHYPFHPLDLDDILSRIQRPKLMNTRTTCSWYFTFQYTGNGSGCLPPVSYRCLLAKTT